MKKTLLRKYYNMRQRCYNPNCLGFKHYGVKGVKMCDAWLNDPNTFIDWGLSHGYEPGMHIHRIDNAPIYSPETCELLTFKEHMKKHRGLIEDDFFKPIKIHYFDEQKKHKVYCLRPNKFMTREFLEKFKKAAANANMSLSEWATRAIDEELKREQQT